MTDERRRYFRIEDEALLALERIDKATIDDRLEDFWTNEHAISIRNNYNFQIEQHIADRHKIDSKMPELGRPCIRRPTEIAFMCAMQTRTSASVHLKASNRI